MKLLRLVITIASLSLLLGCGNKQTPAPAEGKAEAPAPDVAAEPSEAPAEASKPVPDVAVAPEKEAADGDAALKEKQLEIAKRKRETLLSNEAPKGTEEVVAWSGSHRIYKADFENYVDRLPPAQRREFSSLEKKQEMVRNMITFYTLAKEAEAMGLDKDPDVLLAMQTEMVKKLLQKKFGEGAEVAVDDAAVEARYQEHFKRYNKPARVRASHILLSDGATAEKVYKELKKEIEVPGNSTRKVFREFVRKYSEDDATRERGGDLLFFSQDGSRDGAVKLDPKLAQAAFLIQNINQVSRVVETESGFHILLTTNRREEISQPLEEVRDAIRANLKRERLEQERKQFMADLVDFDAWHIEAQQLDTISLETAPSEPSVKARMDSIKKVVDPNAPPKSTQD